MRSVFVMLLCGTLLALVGTVGFAQDEIPATETPSPPADVTEPESKTADQLKEATEKLAAETQRRAGEIAKQVDADPRAKEAAAGVLQPIYQVAETLSFPAFHWIAFALMATGVVSYALQLVIGKLIVLAHLGFSPAEILSDAVGLVISILGLVLTTQAAAENSTFTQSPAAVLSATAVGVVVGFVLYLWGQSQEVQAAAARSQPPKV